MTLRERLEHGERRRRQEPMSELRRRTDRTLVVIAPDTRPQWMRRALPAKDETGAIK